MSSSNHFMVSSSSTDPMFQQIQNLPMAPEARYTYNHHNLPVAPQDPFQAQNLQKHQWDQENKFQRFDHVHGSYQPQNLQWSHKNWHHHDIMHMNHQNHQSSSGNFHNQENIALDFHNHHQFPQNRHVAQKNQEIPDNYMNHHAARNSFNPDFTNNQIMNPQMSQQLALNAPNHQPGPSSFQQIPDNYMNYQMLHQPVTQTTNNRLMNQMPPAFGTHGTPNYIAFPQHNYGFPSPRNPNSLTGPIAFNLLNSATWKFLSTFPNEMMVTNDGRAIFPRFEIGIMNLIPKANYNVGIKLQLVNPQKHTYKENKWRKVDRRKSKELPEPETNEVYSKVQTGQDIMDNGLKMKLVMIYTIGNEKKKTRATSGPMTEERTRILENKKEMRAQKMIRVFSQQKYVPIFTLYQQMDFGIPQPIATTQFPDTEFITTTSYRNETVKKWKRDHNEFVRGDLRDLNL